MKIIKKNFLVLLKKEIYLNYLISPLGIIFLGLFYLISQWLFFQDFFLINQASLTPLFSTIPFLFLFFLPAITMNLFAEEKRSKTWEILLTLPTNEESVVLTKFLSAFLFASVGILLTLPSVIVIFVLGKPDWGVIISNYFGLLLLAGSYISTGMFFSSLTKNSVIAFLTTTFFLLVNFFIGQPMVTERLPDLLGQVISAIALNYNFAILSTGSIPLYTLVFFTSWIFVFIWLTIVSLKSRDY